MEWSGQGACAKIVLANPHFMFDVRPLLPAARAETLTEESTVEAFRRVFMSVVDLLPGELWGRTPTMKQRFGVPKACCAPLVGLGESGVADV